MCGLAGVFAVPLRYEDARLADRANHMAVALARRGPDGHGAWADEAAGIALAHRRLAVLGTSPAGAQPMVSASGQWVISYNGEVYNYRELRKELESQGEVRWRGTSDTEVVLAAIDRWGLTRAIERFVGMFAFAAWDRSSRTLHLARDRLGIKPLCFARARGALLFASDLSAVARDPEFSQQVDPGALHDFLSFGYVPDDAAIYRDADKVPPGTVLRFTSPTSAPSAERFWDATRRRREVRASGPRGQEARDACERAVQRAVEARMVADVPLGAFLSGGIDSSLVVALMQRASSRPVQTFSIGNESKTYDESQSAAQVAAHLGTAHTSLVVTAGDAISLVPDLPDVYDEPFADSSQLPTLLVSRLARRSVTVCLSGDGGDEVFGGYNRHVYVPPLWRAMRVTPGLGRRWLASLLRSVAPGSWDRGFDAWLGPRAPRLAGDKLHKVARLLGSVNAPDLYRRLQLAWECPPGGSPRPTRVRGALPPGGSLREALMHGDLLGYLPGDILTKVDRASMAASLEARVPLLDHRVVEASWCLDPKDLVQAGQGKRLLRGMLGRYVPSILWSRPKMGFGVPVGEWVRGELRDWAEALLSPEHIRAHGLLDVAPVRQVWEAHVEGRANHTAEVWSVLMLQAWLERSRATA